MLNRDLTAIAAGRHYLIATDGARNGNPAKAGWGVLKQLREGETVIHQAVYGAALGDATHIRAEMVAVVQGLSKMADCSVPVIVVTDNKMIMEAMTLGWIEKWQASEWWVGSKPRLNADVWQKILALAEERTIGWQWVRGHAGNAQNEVADMLASRAAKGRYRGAGKSVRDQHPELFF